MRLSAFLNTKLHRMMVRYVLRQYARKSRRVERKHPELFRPTAPALAAKHRQLWSRLGVKSGDRWLRLHVNLTGLQDYTFCPEDIFFARIERILNDCDNSGHGPEDKNNLWRYVPRGAEPETLVRYVRGAFCDAEGRWISESEADARIARASEDLVGKPCDASGGSGVRLFRRSGGVFRDGNAVLSAAWIAKQGHSYVVQRRIRQDAFSASFNKSSVNTVRMMTLRCPWNGEVVVLRSMMRMGVSDTIVDNMMKGGLCVCLDAQGRFGRYAYDYDGKRFEKHPVSGHTFENLTHPSYGAMVSLAKKVAATVPDYHLLSFDLVPREDESVCIVELNATSQGITQLQYDFGGLFGSLSERVVDWCAAHKDLNSFKHFRTFY